MRVIDYYLNTNSPWCYLAGNRLEQIAQKHGARINYKPINTQEIFARTGGTPLPQRHDSRKAYRLQELRRWSEALGMPITLPYPRYFPANPVPACSAIISASEAGGGDVGGLVQSLLRAIWAEEKDNADDAVIGDCLEAHGFSRMLTMTGMLKGAELYQKYTNDAVEAGVFGAPFYIVEGECFWGQDRLDMLDRHLAS